MSEPADHPASPRINEPEDEFFAKTGPVRTSWNELRRHPRFYFRSRVRAKIYPPPAARGQPPFECFLLTSDLSRGGLSLLCHTMLFPGQRIDVWLPDGSQRFLEVLWCKRLEEKCFALGTRFFKPDEGQAAS